VAEHMQWLGCQRPSAATRVPEGSGWLFERKYDGYRAQVVVRNSRLRIFTRTGLDWTREFASVVPALQTLLVTSAVLDGEICVLDGERTDFSLLSAGLRAGAKLTFLAFDVLELDGRDTRRLPLIERKAILTKLVGDRDQGDQLQFVRHVENYGQDLLESMRRMGHEGIVAKRSHSVYQAGVSSDWRKIKCLDRQEFAVIGWTPDPVSGEVKSLALATFECGKPVFRGCVGTGFSRGDRKQIAEALRSQGASSIGTAPASARAPRSIQWVCPSLVAELRFRGLSRHGIVREPTFLGLREDKPVDDVTIAA
jgi:bifunctional non-homologous end joining protein LigD